MNKRSLESYLKKNDREILRNNCFRYEDNYLISDSYSVIKLNDNYNLNVVDDILGVCKIFDNFSNNFEFYKNIDSFEDNDEHYVPIDDKFGINTKLFNRIKKVINAKDFAILKNKGINDYILFIIRLENSKTKEMAYMLPMRKY